MPAHENQHYVQKKLINNFARQCKNGKYKVCLLDLNKFTAEYRNTDSIFYAKNIYDVNNDDIKALEKKLNEKIEVPGFNLIERLVSNSSTDIQINRKELLLIKKYFLIQQYRNLKNMSLYSHPPKDKALLSDCSIKNDESVLDFWKREITTILDADTDADWKALLGNKDMVGIKINAQIIHSSFLMFFSTDYEFVLNDSGPLTERVPMYSLKLDKNDFMKTAKEISKLYFGVDNISDKVFENAYRMREDEGGMLFDTIMFTPMSSNLLIAFVSPLWKYSQELYSPILSKYLSFPQNTYVNERQIYASLDKMTQEEALIKFASPNDRYNYKVQKLNESETIYLNTLIMNEAYQYICFKTPSQTVKDLIREYNKLDGLKNVKHNYKGFIDLINVLPPFDV
ncbi:MAG: DUF4238 domain-containing protein [Clostridiales bacterium]|jgi:hypothetical protein|nr:DUF4238 domain-containing protein [Clostridiales bacterium]